METKLDHILAIITNDGESYRGIVKAFNLKYPFDAFSRLIDRCNVKLRKDVPEWASGEYSIDELTIAVLEHYSGEGYDVLTGDQYYNHADTLLASRPAYMEHPPPAEPTMTPLTVSTKVHVPDKEASIAVQTVALALGFKWYGSEKGPRYTDKQYLYFDTKDKSICHGDDESNFVKNTGYHPFPWRDVAELATATPTPITTTEVLPIMMTIESKTFINGVEASTMSDQQIFANIAAIESEVAKLDAINTKPKKLVAEIKRLTKVATDLAAYVDAR